MKKYNRNISAASVYDTNDSTVPVSLFYYDKWYSRREIEATRRAWYKWRGYLWRLRENAEKLMAIQVVWYAEMTQYEGIWKPVDIMMKPREASEKCACTFTAFSFVLHQWHVNPSTLPCHSVHLIFTFPIPFCDVMEVWWLTVGEALQAYEGAWAGGTSLEGRGRVSYVLYDWGKSDSHVILCSRLERLHSGRHFCIAAMRSMLCLCSLSPVFLLCSVEAADERLLQRGHPEWCMAEISQ